MRCQPGDLAIILRAEVVPEAVGKMVEVIEMAPAGQEFMLPNGKLSFPLPGGYWIVRLIHPCEAHDFGAAHDANLLPIRPEPDEVTEEVRELDTVDG